MIYWRFGLSVKEIKALVRHLIEETNKGKRAAMVVIDELYGADIVFHCPRGWDICGLEDFKKANEESFDEIPDAHSTIDDIIVEGDKVAMRLTMTGTYSGKLGKTGSSKKK